MELLGRLACPEDSSSGTIVDPGISVSWSVADNSIVLELGLDPGSELELELELELDRNLGPGLEFGFELGPEPDRSLESEPEPTPELDSIELRPRRAPLRDTPTGIRSWSPCWPFL